MSEALERFIEAQAETYEEALKEIKAGHKVTHWMWWIFPQYQGIGVSAVSMHYAIKSRAEARAYWEHPLLGERLRECMLALLDLNTNDAVEVFGEIDAKKLQSCATLFYFHGGGNICWCVLEKFFSGRFDFGTLDLLLKE